AQRVSNPTQAGALAAEVARRLDALAPPLERGWTGLPEPPRGNLPGGLVFRRTLRGVTESRIIDGELIRSGEARRLDSLSGQLRSVYEAPARLTIKDVETEHYGPVSLIERI